MAKLYYNRECDDEVRTPDDWEDGFWKSEHLTDVDDLTDCYEMEDLTMLAISDVEGKFLVVELDSEDTPDFPYIPRRVWDGIEAYNDLFSDIQSGQDMTLAAAIMQLKLLRGHPVPELAYAGHGFTGWDGRIIRVE
uniref:Uncharacterized protein n=1 Tax=Candidatus Methanogaster sp. ANME-2c ERB4 TaxID=2759911 RepID=A0A7G9Y693_9EURY|nr:hypothetical protein HEBJAHIM_00005 [Methanosarcinales archaeon ANME-2c ERB4]QNO42118.1 hypothetical protein INBEEEIC_00020 [Methanosarcinales archaeon ANME-2c ERB4]QNO42276.1 hypothetical protein CCKMDOMK_00005 [Methanosarcinales archaeon ANME-2c ERB4]QNO42484.1 hypothetical protein LBOOMNCC_00037 [Methanosarcinales archaeon ANME-2c ERB4]QNO42569.1 hypothetical protein MMDHCPHC_00005 [Methanosarcinales archaeon ANME-2c ERB4]